MCSTPGARTNRRALPVGQVPVGQVCRHRLGVRQGAAARRRNGLAARLVQHRGLQGAQEEQDIARLGPGGVRRHVGRDQHRRRDLVPVGGGIAHQHVPSHGMPEQGETAVAPRQPGREPGHLLQGPEQNRDPPLLVLRRWRRRARRCGHAPGSRTSPRGSHCEPGSPQRAASTAGNRRNRGQSRPPGPGQGVPRSGERG